MRILSVFTIVLVGAAATATAEPKQEENNARVRYGDEQAKAEPAPSAHHEGEWVQLATPTPAKHGTEFVVVGAEQGSFGKLRITAAKGAVFVERVKVYFDDGKEKVVQVDRRLDASRTPAEIDLKTSKAIDRIVVTTDAHGNGTYAVYGSSGGAGVASR